MRKLIGSSCAVCARMGRRFHLRGDNPDSPYLD